MDKMTIAKGLIELKLLDKRIEKAIEDVAFCQHRIGEDEIKGYKSVQEYESIVRGKEQSILDLINRRTSIKSAIVESNAKTKVTIAGEKMTRADAIERRNHSIVYEKTLLEKMKRDLARSVSSIEADNARAKERLDRQIEIMIGKDGKVKPEETQSTTDMFWKHNRSELVDPIGVREKIEKLEKRIDDFESEVDTVLNESNVLTSISIQ